MLIFKAYTGGNQFGRCTYNVCFNNGACFQYPDGRTSCQCQIGFGGEYCQNIITGSECL